MRPQLWTCAVATALGLGLVSLAPEAVAYVRYTARGTAFAWPQSCLAITAYPGSFTTMMTLDEIKNAAGGAAFVWTGAAYPCTNLAITVSMSTDPAPRAVNDGRNSLIFRTGSWCLLNADGSCDPTSAAYDPAALALTSVSASTSTGYIKDVDIEVNGFEHWADLVAHPELDGPGTSFNDLQNDLAHEMGHLIGLDHTCAPPNTTPRPLDNLGNPVPDCDKAPPDVIATTMFPSANPGDISKRDLAPDDQQAVCDIYSASAALPCMAPPDGGTTGTAGATGTAGTMGTAGTAGTMGTAGTTGTAGTAGGGGTTGTAGTAGGGGTTGTAGTAGGGGTTGTAGRTGGGGATGGGGCGCRLGTHSADRGTLLLIGVMTLLARRRRPRW
jgi:MYXO-CTERM domain-containing protein